MVPPCISCIVRTQWQTWLPNQISEDELAFGAFYALKRVPPANPVPEQPIPQIFKVIPASGPATGRLEIIDFYLGSAALGFERLLKQFLKRGADCDCRDVNKFTPLHLAALSCVQLEGADISD